MIFNDVLIQAYCEAHQMIVPFVQRGVFHGKTFGLGPCTYDVRVAQDIELEPQGFVLASTMERFKMPNDVCATVQDKSSWAREGIAVQNTHLDPGWEGYLTLELTNHTKGWKHIRAGSPIAQIKFEQLIGPARNPYSGKYQNQPARPIGAIHEP